MSESEPGQRIDRRETTDRTQTLSRGQGKPAGLIKEFPKKRHQRAVMGGTSPCREEQGRQHLGPRRPGKRAMTEAPE